MVSNIEFLRTLEDIHLAFQTLHKRLDKKDQYNKILVENQIKSLEEKMKKYKPKPKKNEIHYKFNMPIKKD